METTQKDTIMKKKIDYKKISLCVTFVVLVAMTVQYWNYVEIAKTTVPFMDFWRWIAVYGEKVQNKTIQFHDYFNSDCGEHIQPIAMMIYFTILGRTDFNIAALVEIGSIFQIILAFSMVGFFWFSSAKTCKVDTVVKSITTCILFLCVINYNQWEMTTEPFSVALAYRLINYYLSFILAAYWLANMEKRSLKKNLLFSFVFGCFCAFLTLFVGAAYFVGHLVAIGLSCLWVLIQRRNMWKNYLCPMFVWGILSFVSAVVYAYILLHRGTQIQDISLNWGTLTVELIQGVCLFWGAALIPTPFINSHGSQIVAILGAVVLIVAVIVLVRYLKQHCDGSGMFPVICFLYAFVISIAITMGRYGKFGISTMVSSRYVVESSIGLFGLIWMAYFLWSGKRKEDRREILSIIAIAFSGLMLLFSAKVQIAFSPYMKESFEKLKVIMQNINEYSDEELTGFQANDPNDIRYCVDFLMKNGLSIFRSTVK